MLKSQHRLILKPYSHAYTLLIFHTIGSPAPDSPSQDAATCLFRVFAQTDNAEALAPNKYLRSTCDNIMQPYPGGTYHLHIRQGLPKPFYEYHSTLIPQTEIQHVVHFEGKETVIPPPPRTQAFAERQPSQAETEHKFDLVDFGPTEKVPLGSIVYARSEDKGSDCNCGLWIPSSLFPSESEREDVYTWLRNLLSIDNVKKLLAAEIVPSPSPNSANGEMWAGSGNPVQIERFELPNLRGVHFLSRGLLDRGVTSSSGIDSGEEYCGVL